MRESGDRAPLWMGRLAGSTAGRIVDRLRRRPHTVDELAAELDLSGTAVRAQLATLEREGFVERGELRRGTSKPSRTYVVAPDAELRFSRLYIPVLTQLLGVLSRQLPPKAFGKTLGEAGRGLAASVATPRGSLRSRVDDAAAMLNTLGGLAHVEEPDGQLTIRSDGCPLGAVTASYPETCKAVEAFLAEVVGTRVRACCEHTDRPRCCFTVA